MGLSSQAPRASKQAKKRRSQIPVSRRKAAGDSPVRGPVRGPVPLVGRAGSDWTPRNPRVSEGRYGGARAGPSRRNAGHSPVTRGARAGGAPVGRNPGGRESRAGAGDSPVTGPETPVPCPGHLGDVGGREGRRLGATASVEVNRCAAQDERRYQGGTKSAPCWPVVVECGFRLAGERPLRGHARGTRPPLRVFKSTCRSIFLRRFWPLASIIGSRILTAHRSRVGRSKRSVFPNRRDDVDFGPVMASISTITP